MLASSVHRGSTLNKDKPASKTHSVLTCSLSSVHRGSSLAPNQLPKDRNRLRCSTCSPCPNLHTCQKCQLLCHRTCANRPVVWPGDCTHQITLVLLEINCSFLSLQRVKSGARYCRTLRRVHRGAATTARARSPGDGCWCSGGSTAARSWRTCIS